MLLDIRNIKIEYQFNCLFPFESFGLELCSLIFDTHLGRWRYLFIFNFRTPDSPTRKWTHQHENVSGKFKRRKMMN